MYFYAAPEFVTTHLGKKDIVHTEDLDAAERAARGALLADTVDAEVTESMPARTNDGVHTKVLADGTGHAVNLHILSNRRRRNSDENEPPVGVEPERCATRGLPPPASASP